MLIANSLLVPKWATWDEFRRLEAEGLTMFGQMTAGSWIYIGTQGILQGTYQTFCAAGEVHFGSADLSGRTVLTAGLGGMGGAQPLAATMAGAAILCVEVDQRSIDRRLATRYVDEQASSLDDAVARVRAAAADGRALSVALLGNAADVFPELVAREEHFDLVTDQTAAHDPLTGYVPAEVPFELLGIGAMALATVAASSSIALAEKAKIGISIPAATHGWTGGLNYHTKRTVDALRKAYPDLEFVITTADSATKQVNDIEDLVAVQKINALVVLPFESDPLTEPVKEAKKQGVFVTTVDRGLSEEGIEDLYVGGNNPEYGRIAAEYFKTKLKGKGKVVVMRGIPTAIDNIRIDAFKKALDGTGVQVLDMQYANWNPDKGFEVMQDYLQRFPQIDGVWAGDDDAALGAIEAINQAGRDKGMIVLGGSGMNKVIKRIMDGDKLIDADIFYPPTLIIPAIGATAMKFATGAPVSGRWVLGSPLITKENAEQYYFPESPY